MRRAFKGNRFVLVTGLLVLTAAMFVFIDPSLDRDIKIIDPVQEVVNSGDLSSKPSFLLTSVEEAKIDSTLIGYKKPNESAMLLRVKELRGQDWRVGDEFSVVIPQTGYALETQIEEVRELVPGVTTIKSYPDETMANHVLLTVGRKNTFMSLFTPDGEYELVGGQEYGWLVPSASLPGPTADDFVLVEGPILREAPPQIVRVPTDG